MNEKKKYVKCCEQKRKNVYDECDCAYSIDEERTQRTREREKSD